MIWPGTIDLIDGWKSCEGLPFHEEGEQGGKENTGPVRNCSHKSEGKPDKALLHAYGLSDQELER